MAGLAAEHDRLTGELSLGWKQRLALGCAVLHEPPILFLDEPTSGVDPISRRRFWDLIYSLADGGTTVFVTTHYMEEAEYCHRLALMNRGRLIALDTPAGLRASAHELLFELATPEPVAALAALDDAPEVVRAGLFGRDLHVTVTDRDAALSALPRRLAARGVELTRLREIPPSLEDVFIALVQASGGALED
jgi:ABC-2 type transport system ATP-binding protein